MKKLFKNYIYLFVLSLLSINIHSMDVYSSQIFIVDDHRPYVNVFPKYCECDNANFESRQKFTDDIVKSLSEVDVGEKIIITSFGAGKLRQELEIIEKLQEKEANDITLLAIDFIYENNVDYLYMLKNIFPNINIVGFSSLHAYLHYFASLNIEDAYHVALMIDAQAPLINFMSMMPRIGELRLKTGIQDFNELMNIVMAEHIANTPMNLEFAQLLSITKPSDAYSLEKNTTLKLRVVEGKLVKEKY